MHTQQGTVMTTSYDVFYSSVNNLLVAQGEQPLSAADISTMIHCYGYGNSPEMAVWNVRHGRAFRVLQDGKPV